MANGFYEISNVALDGGRESVGLGILEITAIPHASIIGSESADEIVARYRREFSGLLSEIYQQYRQFRISSGENHELSLELLWISYAVQNQPYRSGIRLFLIVRAIDQTATQAQREVEVCLRICQATLLAQKYDVSPMAYSDFKPIFEQVRDEFGRAIIREAQAVNLQNGIIPLCFAYDRFPDNHQDLSRIANALKDAPNCAVSLQLIPAEYSESENSIIDKTLQGLNLLSQGLLEQGIGNVTNPLARKHAETYAYYAQHKREALFQYNIVVYGETGSVENIATRVFGNINGFGETTISMQYLDLGSSDLNKNWNFFPMPWALHERIQHDAKASVNRMNPSFFAAQRRLPFIITAEEASSFFRLPVGSDSVSAGFIVSQTGKMGKTYEGSIINGADIDVGFLRTSAEKDRIGFMLDDLTKHMLIVGTPGSGKTTFSIGLLDRLWKQHGIPFLIIEPAKNEYRALIESIPELQVFTPGKSHLSPYFVNPFLPPKNVRLESYKASLKTAFTAAVTMVSPLDKIFEEAISDCYSDFKWLDSYTSDDNGEVFNIADFVACFQKTFDAIGYTGDVRNIGKAGMVRLKSMVRLFDNYSSIPIGDLLERPTLIEMSAIENSDEKALLISLLLLSILAYVNSNYLVAGKLRNVIMLEEAHVLLDAEVNRIPGEADPSGIAQRLIRRMLAEIRAYGVGMVIADQSPRKVTADVVAMTDIKLAFRLVEAGDRQMIVDSTNMSTMQANRLSRFKPGEAFCYFHRLEEPEEVITPDYRKQNNIQITLSDEGIRPMLTYWRGKEKMLRPYPECSHIKYCEQNCDRNIRALSREISRRIYIKHLTPLSDNYKDIQSIWAQLTRLVKNELNGEPFSPRLYACVMVRLSRLVRYETKVGIPQDVIERALKKV